MFEPFELERISQLSTPNLVLALVTNQSHPGLTTKNKITLVLDGIQDPGNLGTIIRIADWFGIGQIICSEDSADAFNPKVIQSTMGSIMRVQVGYYPLQEWLQQQPEINIYAASLDGTDIKQMGKIEEGIIVIGNESKGISENIFRLSTKKITIPGTGRAESLNAAVATGIILSHLC